MDNKKDLTKVQNEKVDSLEAEIQSLIDNGTEIQPWLGDRDIINPTTDEIMGTRVTKNVNVTVPEALLSKAGKAIEFLKNSSRYITCKVFGNELIAIAHRVDELRGINILQFSEPNTGSYFNSTSEDAQSKFDRVWNVDMPASTKQLATAEADDNTPF